MAVVTAIPIVALDFPDAERAMTLVQTLDERCRFYKVGSELFTASGADIIQWLRDTGCDVFLDLRTQNLTPLGRVLLTCAKFLDQELVVSLG